MSDLLGPTGLCGHGVVAASCPKCKEQELSDLREHIRMLEREVKRLSNVPQTRIEAVLMEGEPPKHLKILMVSQYPNGLRIVVGEESPKEAPNSSEGMTCPTCGSILQRAGTCLRCPNCAWNTGCD